jgi:putative inorganic carbon (HCO3(-)) transporter
LLLPALLIAAGFWLVRWLASGRLSIRTPADWPIIGLVATIPLTLLVTAYPETTTIQVYRLLTGIALYYALANWTASTVRFRLLWGGIGLVGAMLAVFALISVEEIQKTGAFVPASFSDTFVQTISDAVNPNVMAGQLVILLPMLLAPLVFAVRWPVRWLLWLLTSGGILVMVGVLLLTQSRGALIALGVALATMFLLRWPESWLRVVLLTLIGGAGLHLFGWERLLDLVFAKDALGGTEGRIEIWTRAWYILQDFPFTGCGMGNFQQTVAFLYPYSITPEGKGEHAHNIFFQVGADLGLGGLIAWLSLLLLVFVAAWQAYRYGAAAGNNEIAAAGAGLFCSQVALVMHGMVDAVTWGMIRPAPLVWVLWGLAVVSKPAFAGKN